MTVVATWLADLYQLKFKDLANIQTVGVGLYLALTIIQAVSSSGISSLRRRVNALTEAVKTTKSAPDIANMHRLAAEVSRIEIGFQRFNATLMWIIFALFTFSLLYFGYSTARPEWYAGQAGATFIYVYFLGLPNFIFAGSAMLIGSRCATVRKSIRDAEKAFLSRP